MWSIVVCFAVWHVHTLSLFFGEEITVCPATPACPSASQELTKKKELSKVGVLQTTRESRNRE